MNDLTLVNYTHNDPKFAHRSGTSYRGSVDISYDKLVELFGKPNTEYGDGKVRASWILNIGGMDVTIYDWKDSTPIAKVRDWHVGGKGNAAPVILQAYLAGLEVK